MLAAVLFRPRSIRGRGMPRSPKRWPSCWRGAGRRRCARGRSPSNGASVDAELRGLQERAALARGRAEIARELHDVVAHHVSLIAVRAATAPYQLDAVSEPTSAAFTEIAAEARAALDDLRAVLGVLRTADGKFRKRRNRAWPTARAAASGCGPTA